MSIDAARFRALFPRLAGNLTETALAPLLEMLRPRPFAVEEQLCTRGVHSARALFIIRGQVELRACSNEVAMTLGVLDAGRWTNSIPLIEPGQAEFDVWGRVAGAAVEMTHGDLLALRRDHPQTARIFLAGLIADLSVRLRASELAVGKKPVPPTLSLVRSATGWLGGAALPLEPEPFVIGEDI